MNKTKTVQQRECKGIIGALMPKTAQATQSNSNAKWKEHKANVECQKVLIMTQSRTND